MITDCVIDGKKGKAMFVDANMEPVDSADKASFVRVLFDDGSTLTGTVAQDQPTVSDTES